LFGKTTSLSNYSVKTNHINDQYLFKKNLNDQDKYAYKQHLHGRGITQTILQMCQDLEAY
jgi:hypothetical protein